MYIVCAITVALYAVVAALMYIGRVHYFREDGACVTGVELFASIPLLSYDLYVNIFLTSLFLWPLVKTGKIHPMLRRVAKRTLVAAAVALTTSSVNVLVLTLQHGRELGWVCLGSCGADVICNALALFWATERLGPRFSTNLRIEHSGFLGGAHDAYTDDNSKPRVVISDNHEGSFPSFAPSRTMPAVVKGYQHDSLCKSDVSMTPSNQSAPQLSVKFNPLSQSRPSGLPWSMESVTGFFRKSQEQDREEHQLEVTVTTEREVLEERRFSSAAM